MTAESKHLFLTTFHGRVWRCFGGQLPEDSGCSPAECPSSLMNEDVVLRLLGLSEDAELILSLYDAGLPVELASPLVCETEMERRIPDIALQQMQEFERAPSQGGYHRMTDQDAVSYRLLHIFRQHEGHLYLPAYLRTGVLEILYQHPAWFPLSFLQPLDELSCARVIARIRDPRWFVDPRKPEACDRLYQYLGLFPANQQRVVVGQVPLSGNLRACQEVLSCWKDEEYAVQAARYLETAGLKPVADSDLPGLRPADFLWRIWCSHASSLDGRASRPIIGDLRASQMFIRFLRSCWLEGLYRDSPRLPPGTSLFEADKIFRHPCEWSAYLRHLGQPTD